MRNLVSEYVNQFRQDRQKQVKLAAVLAALAVLVAGVVFWQLHNTGVAMTNEVYCGMEEHTHNDSCYEQELICTSEDPDHVHNDSCYETVLVCDLPEHTHTVDCLVDETADVETADVWEDTLPVLSGIWADDVAAIAESQVGYTESEANYILADDGTTHLGYNRYGAWYGNEYGDWDAMFASFCLNYAEVPESEAPENSGAYALAVAMDSDGLYMDISTGFVPKSGDLIFFDGDQDGQADRVGIVIEAEEDELIVVEGNYEDSVAENTYNNDEPEIMAFGMLPEQDLSPEAGMFTISYSGEIPGGAEVEGPVVAQEGTNQYFYVTVSEGYEINEVTANGDELTKIDIKEAEDGESVTYTYILEDISGDTIVVLDATQALKGSGSVDVVIYNGESEGKTYTLTVTDVPTNTKISLNSPRITLTDGNEPVSDITLEGTLYFVEDGKDFEDGQLVSYLMLDEDIDAEEGVYVLTAYAEDNNSFVMNDGKLFLYIPGDFDDVDTALIWQIQTNKLCSLDNSGTYQQELIEAVAAFNPITVAINDYAQNTPIELIDLMGDMSEKYYDEFYYGSVDPFNLTECTQGEIVNGQLFPLDKNGNLVDDDDVSIYVVYDQVYSFDVEVNEVVNEHTEDNGDTYLWFGDTFYIDQYHAQGADGYEQEGKSTGYTRSQNTLTNCGVWVQLGRIREEEIKAAIGNGNEAETAFNAYSNVSYADMIKVVDLDGYDSQNAKNTAAENAPYGIVGPYKTDETAPVSKTVRITGHVGDEFTQTEIFNNETVYMIREDQGLQTDWINLGSHASDNGFRSWFYWITDYYKLNNHQDELEFVEIYRNSAGEIRLQADEIGSSGEGQKEDVWEITGLYTKRNSVIKEYMLENMEALEEEDVGFYEYAGWMHHIQLRTNTTVETVIDDVVYNGTFQIFYDDSTPSVEYKIKREATNLAGDEYSEYGEYLTGTAILERDNDQETKQYKFFTDDGVAFYVKPEYAEDTEMVEITVTVHATGTMSNDNGQKIEYTDDNPLIYTTTLTAEQLKEAVDDCPDNEGYDVAINLADIIKVDNELSIILYKIWDDDNNSRNSRDDVTYVTVSLERSEDGENWEPVLDELGQVKAFTIRKNSDTNTWSLTLHNSDLDLTYKEVIAEGSDGEDITEDVEYYFRIAEEQEIVGVAEGFYYTYVIGEFSKDEESNGSLIVMNSLNYEIGFTGEKKWLDQDGNELDEDDSRIPDSVIIGIDQNGEFYTMTEATKADGWTFTFDNLPQAVYGGDDVYEYTLYELDEYGNRVGNDGFILIDGLLYHVGIDSPDGNEDGDNTYYLISNTVYTTELPVTGGTGTWIFTVAGVCLISGAAAALVYRKRRAVRS